MPLSASERARSEKSTTADLPAYSNCVVELKRDEYLFAQNGHNPVVLSSTSMQAAQEATKENAPEAMESEPIEAVNIHSKLISRFFFLSDHEFIELSPIFLQFYIK